MRQILCGQNSRRSIGRAGWLAMLVAAGAILAGPSAWAADPVHVYIGTYTGKNSQGIYLIEMDPATGKLSEPVVAAETVNPSFLAIHPSKKFLYSVGEIGKFEGKPVGAVSAFSIGEDGKLTLINQQPSGGGGPCHVSLDPSGKVVLVANYGGGSVASLPIAPDGSLKAPASEVQHTGSSVDPRRQKEPHAHSINPDPAGKFAFAADLGLDKVLVYKLDAGAGTITANDPAFAQLPPGSGPRHFAFHPSGKYAFVNNEMTSTISSFAYDADKGTLTLIETLTTLPAGFEGNNSTAETVVHPSGKFVYVSNRGHDSVAIYGFDAATGKLTPAGHQSTGGKTPRNFNIDPSGKFMLAANQTTGNVVVFAIDPETGKPTPTGSEVKVGAPVCVRFLVK